MTLKTEDQIIRDTNIHKIQEEIINAERGLILTLQKLAEIRFELDDIDTPKM